MSPEYQHAPKSRDPETALESAGEQMDVALINFEHSLAAIEELTGRDGEVGVVDEERLQIASANLEETRDTYVDTVKTYQNLISLEGRRNHMN